MRPHPHLLQINTAVFLNRLSERAAKKIGLAAVPQEEWEKVAALGFDYVWLMGIWQRSARSKEEALKNSHLRRLFDQTLPGWKERDVTGSPYAVFDYKVEPSFGGEKGLSEARKKLNRLGLGLMLDFVPNHVALDHPWTLSHPERFVQVGAATAAKNPDLFFKTKGGHFLAHGRDPNFPPWTDTAQVNFFSRDLREAWKKELLAIAEMADGVRCDMAMLGMGEIFEGIWQPFLKGPVPREEFWPPAIRAVKERHPSFLFLAEAYWNREWPLQQMGFDFTYDKVLYDRLRFSKAADIEAHLKPNGLYQKRSAHFIENHDEERAAKAFDRRQRAAAVIMSTLPGMRFFHDGQGQGKQVRLPIQLNREPTEVENPEIKKFYQRLFAILQDESFHLGYWRSLDKVAAGHSGEPHVLGWSWRYGDHLKIIAVNYSSEHAQAAFKIPSVDPGLPVTDELNVLNPAELEITEDRLDIQLEPWGACILTCGDR